MVHRFGYGDVIMGTQTVKSHGNASTHWMLERVTSMALVPLTLWLIYSIVTLGGLTHVDFLIWIKNPTNAGLLAVTILTSFYHAALGLQVVIDDYVSGASGNRVLSSAVRIIFTAMAVASVFFIVEIVYKS